ncbi:hypothetical protein F5984_11225 [Rudanella paleaurantiibacter]|jgi:hypothetical protein|uniref:Uncharacterized protein n=1 Tax=Rudanella paleaurantiibacter TaxID=2614655 RepID=A0A7J5U0T4_9BACT|nr:MULTISPECIES: hypothetical protein [Rudanella]KAB7731358.1 hypothetical protein F5984_11225 [Rudanella paleaurantiibacter]
MNVKRIFGIILTLLGLIGLLLGGKDLMAGGVAQASLVYLGLGAIFFFTGISLIRTTSDTAK